MREDFPELVEVAEPDFVPEGFGAEGAGFLDESGGGDGDDPAEEEAEEGEAGGSPAVFGGLEAGVEPEPHGDAAGEDGEDGEHFEQPAGEAEAASADQFLDDAHLGGAEAGGLDGEEEEPEHAEPEALEGDSGKDQGEDGELEPGEEKDDALLGEGVGDPARHRSEEDEGEDEEDAEDVDEPFPEGVAGFLGQPDPQREEGELDGLVVEGVLGLHGHEAPKGEPVSLARLVVHAGGLGSKGRGGGSHGAFQEKRSSPDWKILTRTTRKRHAAPGGLSVTSRKFRKF